MNDDRPVLDQVNLVVSDMDASIAFYRRLGVDIAPTLPEWEGHHRTAATPDGLDFDLDSNAFAQRWNHGWEEGRTGAVITFKVVTRAAVDRIYDELTGAGYQGQMAPYDAFWGARFAIVEDPDGNAVGIMSLSDPAHRAPTPELPH
jgi:catechol 2,3-dioxygenase-like lactoylglutathione lyase family enzyme